jgi:hypothetical protein
MRKLSTYALGALLGALMATGLFDGPLSLVSAEQLFRPAAFPAPLTLVDRSLKGDRLPLRPDPGTTIVIKRDGAPAAPAIDVKETHDPRLAPASLRDCEPVASPYADPRLGKFAGRCFV